jgi:hypothetical protein
LRPEFSGYRRNIPLLFGEKSLEQFVFDLFILKRALKQTRGVCLRVLIRRLRKAHCVIQNVADYDPEELPVGVSVRAGQRQPAGADFGEGAWSSEAFRPLLAEMRQGVAQRRAGDLHHSLERRVHRQDQEDRT